MERGLHTQSCESAISTGSVLPFGDDCKMFGENSSNIRIIIERASDLNQ